MQLKASSVLSVLNYQPRRVFRIETPYIKIFGVSSVLTFFSLLIVYPLLIVLSQVWVRVKG